MLRGTWSLLSAVLWRLPDKEREEAADVLLILGGSEQRELACARLHSGEALLILSSGAAREEDLASAARIDRSRVVVDARAVCTITNFTTLADELARAGCRSVCVATSPAHMRRAYAVGCLCLGSRGMAVRRKVCGSKDDPSSAGESVLRTVRDLLRSFLWLLSGWDGGGVAGWWYPDRRRMAAEATAGLPSLYIAETLSRWRSRSRAASKKCS